MFTGLIEELGRIADLHNKKLTVESTVVIQDLNLGDSIAVNGVCLTVMEKNSRNFAVEVMPETLRRTNLGYLRYGNIVNLERAMPVGGRFGGHFVQGHIDATGKITGLKKEDQSTIVRISAPPEITAYVVPKGFIAIDGISLTVVDCDKTSFSVALIPFTKALTTLGNKSRGDTVNLESDILAKYVERFIRQDNNTITMDYLAEHGFLQVR